MRTSVSLPVAYVDNQPMTGLQNKREIIIGVDIMTATSFKKKVLAYARKSGIPQAGVFFELEQGIFIARIPTEEVRVIGRPGTDSLSWKWHGRTFVSEAC